MGGRVQLRAGRRAGAGGRREPNRRAPGQYNPMPSQAAKLLSTASGPGANWHFPATPGARPPARTLPAQPSAHLTVGACRPWMRCCSTAAAKLASVDLAMWWPMNLGRPSSVMHSLLSRHSSESGTLPAQSAGGTNKQGAWGRLVRACCVCVHVRVYVRVACARLGGLRSGAVAPAATQGATCQGAWPCLPRPLPPPPAVERAGEGRKLLRSAAARTPVRTSIEARTHSAPGSACPPGPH